jgi:hypothetical protein
MKRKQYTTTVSWVDSKDFSERESKLISVLVEEAFRELSKQGNALRQPTMKHYHSIGTTNKVYEMKR